MADPTLEECATAIHANKINSSLQTTGRISLPTKHVERSSHKRTSCCILFAASAVSCLHTSSCSLHQKLLRQLFFLFTLTFWRQVSCGNSKSPPKRGTAPKTGDASSPNCPITCLQFALFIQSQIFPHSSSPSPPAKKSHPPVSLQSAGSSNSVRVFEVHDVRHEARRSSRRRQVRQDYGSHH